LPLMGGDIIMRQKEKSDTVGGVMSL
jgi:hypothetical protein